MDYLETLAYIHGTERFGSKLGLDSISTLLDLMGNPHEGLNIIHVAGTNGKGSTASFIASVLMEQGYRTGLYTSPYVEEFTERIRIDGQNIPKEMLAEIGTFTRSKIEEMLSKGLEHPTEFEIITAIGFEYFKREQVDFLILEVGLGGRADATNIIKKPLISVLTPIAMDHTNCLGNTLGEIAYEKAGIIKPDGLVISYPQASEAMQVIGEICNKQNARLIQAPINSISIIERSETFQRFDAQYGDNYLNDLKIQMIGDHQVENAVLAMTVLYELNSKYNIKIDIATLYTGLAKTFWAGRLELIHKDPIILIDGAHNPHSMNSLVKVLRKLFPYKKLILGIGMLGDKDITGMLDIIVPYAEKLILTEPDNPRAFPIQKLESLIIKYKRPYVMEKNISRAVQAALKLAEPDSIIVFAGSLYMIGDLRRQFKVEFQSAASS